jgi:hypothetical protein
MCVRNYKGHFLKATTFWHDGCPPPQEVEAIGLRDAIYCLGRLGLSKVLIELDCKLVVDSIVDKKILTKLSSVVLYLNVKLFYNNIQTLR